MKQRSRASLPVKTLAVLLLSTPLFASLTLAPNEPAPDLKGKVLGGTGEVVDWSDAELTLVNFWATWCAPCKKEMPELQSWLDAWEDKGLRVYGVSQDRRKQEPMILAYLNGLGVEYPVFHPGIKISINWGRVESLPTTFLVNREGIIVARFNSASPETLEAMKTRIMEHLGVEAEPDSADKDRGKSGADGKAENEQDTEDLQPDSNTSPE